MTASSRPPYGSRPGAPAAGAPLRLGHLVPERRPVVIQRPNPDWLALQPDDPRLETTPEMLDVILQGYVFGERCPGVVKAELASIEEQYQKQLELASGDEQGNGSSTAAFLTGWHTFLRESIQALVPGLTPGEADVLASVQPGSDGPGTELLRYLGLWRDPTGAGGDADPEAVGGEAHSTTEPSSPISPVSTDSDPISS